MSESSKVAMNVESGSKANFHSRLLVSAAASALLFAIATPAYAAGCSYSSNTVTCASGPGSASDDPGIATATLDPNLDMVVDSGAAVDGSPFLFESGATPGAFTLNVALTGSDITTVAGNIEALGDPTQSGNTATVDNSGSLSGGLILGTGTAVPGEGGAFGGATSVKNEATGSILFLDTASAAGTSVENDAGGVIGSVFIDTVNNPATTVFATRTFDSSTNLSTDDETSTFKNVGGPANVANDGTITNSVAMYGTDTTFNNSGTGTVGGDVIVSSLNSYGPDTTFDFTDTYLDTTNTGTIDDKNGNGYADSFQSTLTTSATAWGGSAKVTNAGTLNGAELTVFAADTIGFDNSGLIAGDVSLGTTGAVSSKDVSTETETDNGLVVDDATTDKSSTTPTGGAITASNAATTGEIDGNFSAFGTGDTSLDNAGLIKGNVTVSSSNNSTSFASSTDVNFSDVPDVNTTKSVASPPNTTTTNDFDFTRSFSDSESFTTTTTSVGGNALLTNEATGKIGTDATTPVFVTVTGDASAVAKNAGAILGDILVQSTPEVRVDTNSLSDTQYGAGGFYYNTPSEVYTDHDVSVRTDDGTNPIYESSDSNITTIKTDLSHDSSEATSITEGKGSASLTNSATGLITGNADVFSSGTATLDNAGTIAGSVFVDTVNFGSGLGFNESSSLASQSDRADTNVTDFEYTKVYSGTDYAEQFSNTVTDDTKNTYANASTNNVSTVGATATLTNEAGATLGTDGVFSSVAVEGEASGSLQNDGTIFGNVTVAAGEGSEVIASANSGTSENQSTDTSVQKYTDGNITEDSISPNFLNYHDTASSQFSYDDKFADTGGVATLTNAAADSINGSVWVYGIGTTSADNAGLITGGAKIWAATHNGFGNIVPNYEQSVSEATQSDDLSTGNYDYLYVANAGLTTLASLAVNSTDKNSASDKYISSYTQTVGTGDATLTNEVGGVIDSGGAPFAAQVYGDGSSSISNDGTIVGDATIGYPAALGSPLKDESSSYEQDTSTTGASTVNDSTTYDATGTSVTAYDFKTTSSNTFNQTTKIASTSTDTAGPASYTGSGTLDGSLFVTSVGNASVTNSGMIGDTLGGGFVVVASSGDTVASNSTDTYGTTQDNTDEQVSPDNKALTETKTAHATISDVTNTSSSVTSVGGTASLVNDGTIGGDSTVPITVDIFGDAGASLLNHAHINGNVDVVSSAINTANTSNVTTTFDDNLSNYEKDTPDITVPDTFTQKSTETVKSTFDLASTFSSTHVGGLAQATNTSSLTITGDLTVSGDGGASVTNLGSIWGNVDLASYVSDATSNVTDSTVGTTVTVVNTPVTTVTQTGTSNDETKTTSVASGHDATLTNSGSIGLRVSDANGHTYIYDADFDDSPDGNVSLLANGNVTVANSATGSILGSVNGDATGVTSASDEVTTDAFTNVDTTTVGTPTTEVKTNSDTATETFTSSVTHTGGMATLTNDGTIGQRFASSASGGGGVTAPGGVYLYGDAGASITNTNLIGGDAEAISSVSNKTVSSFDNTTKNGSVTIQPSASALDTQTNTESSGSTTTFTSAGGMATITNAASGQIGPDVLDGFSNSSGANALIYALGDAGATVANAGLMQGEGIEAISNSAVSGNADETITIADSKTVTYTGKGLPFASSSDTYSKTDTTTPTGGVATITNTGKMLYSGGEGESELTVEADGYGGANVTNAVGALIDGSVKAFSDGATIVITKNSTETDRGIAGLDTLSEVTETDTKAYTYSGGASLVDNAGTITGSVEASGYTSAEVLNEAGAKIDGNIVAESVFQNYTLTATTDTTGPSFPSGGTPGPDTFNDVTSYAGNSALVDNFGTVGVLGNGGNVSAFAFQTATVTNEVGATINGNVTVNSLFENVDGHNGLGAAVETNSNGVVTEVAGGGTSTFTNLGTVGGAFDVESFAGSTVTNAANASIDSNAYGANSYMSTYSLTGTNTFTNAGVIGPLPYDAGVIEFQGNTTATNTGIIMEGLVFTNSDAGPSTATFTFGQGSVLMDDINNPADVTDSFGGAQGLAALTLNFTNSGTYPGNIYGATATNKTGAGTWILDGNVLGLGATSIDGTLQIGTPNEADASALLGDVFDISNGFNPLLGNTAINSVFNSNSAGLSSSLILASAESHVVTGEITVGATGALVGDAVFVGDVTNNGTFLSGYMLPSDASLPLGNLLDNTNQVLPGVSEISGNFTQSSTGTLVTNFAPTINRPERQLAGAQAGLFAPTSFWLSVAPFAPDNTPSTLTTVDGTASVDGKVLVYVNKGGLYVDGDSREIMSVTGALTSTATATQSAPSLFVGFSTKTATDGGKNVLDVVVDRTSYASVALNANEASVGHALDSAVPQVVSEIQANAFASVADFTAAQDMAGFLSDLDWQVTSPAQAAQVLSDLAPDGYAAIPAIDTGAGFRSQISRHLTEQRGASEDDPMFGIWANGYGISQNINGNDGAQGLTGSTEGASGGWDVALNNVVLGLAGGYARTFFDTDNKHFSGSINSYQAGAYGDANFGKFYVDATLWGNFGDGNVNRVLPSLDRNVTASVKPTEFRADAEAGYRFGTSGGLGITPYIGFGYRDAQLGEVHEAGAGGLGYDITNLSASFFTPDVGVTLDGNWKYSDMLSVKPLVGAAVVFGQSPGDVTAQFQGGGSPFVISSTDSKNIAFKPEAGVDILVGPSVSVQLGYMGEFGGNGQTNGGWIGVRKDW